MLLLNVRDYSRQQSFCNQASVINKMCLTSGACKEQKSNYIDDFGE